MDSIIRQKSIYESKLINIFTKYSIKFIIRIYETADNLREFQKKLYKIPNWSFDKKDTEYKVFLKYISKKFDESERNLNDALENTYICYIKIMSSVFNYIDIKIPTLNDFWYKVVKKIGKLFYENPRLIKDEYDYIKIRNTIEFILHKYIPIKDIINLPKESEIKPLYYSFSDNESDINKELEYNNKQTIIKKNIDVNDISSEEESEYNKLKYIPSDQFENEYYHSEEISENINLDEIDIKHIDLKK